MRAISIGAVAASLGACAALEDEERKVTLQERNPELADLLEHARTEGRRPSGDELVAIGMEPVSAPTGSNDKLPMSSNSEMQIFEPSLYIENDPPTFYAFAAWRWRYSVDDGYYGWADDVGFGGNIGGVDAFGLHYSRPVVDIYSDTWSCSYSYPIGVQGPGPCAVRDDTRTEANEQNIVHTQQDIGQRFGIYPGINMYQGDLVHIFAPIGDECIQAWATYAHTYDETSITGISLGVTSLGFEWDPAETGWKLASSGSNLFCP